MPIDVDTIAQFLEHGYSVSTYCPYCRRHGPDLDLRKYVDQGKGDMRPAQLVLRHQRCRTRLEIRVKAAKGYGK